MYPQASPLIHDSRKWTYKYEGGSEEPSLQLPQTTTPSLTPSLTQ